MLDRALGLARRYGGVPAVGSEPDPRFTFANERTFLAWARTALALMVAGGAVAQFADGVGEFLRAGLTVTLLGLGSIVAVGGYLRWRRAELEMRLGNPLPRSSGPALFAAMVALLGSGAIAGVLVEVLVRRS